MNDDDGWSMGTAALHVGIERQITGVGDITLDARDDVVALGVTNLQSGARLRERGSRQCEKEDEPESHLRRPRSGRVPMAHSASLSSGSFKTAPGYSSIY